MWDKSHIQTWTESQFCSLWSLLSICSVSGFALPNKSSLFRCFTITENFNINGEENWAQSAGLRFHSDDRDSAVSDRKQGEHCTFYSVVCASSRCNLHLHVHARFCSTSCIWRGTDWFYGDSWLKSPSLWLEELKPIWTRFLKSEDVLHVSDV